MTKLQSLIEDLKKAEKIGKDIQSISITTVKLKNPVEEIIEYAINTNIISGSKDVLTIYKEVSPEVADMVAAKLDKKAKEVKEKEAYEEEHKYAGTYSSVAELNRMWGTSFNNRCLPSGVVIHRC